MSGQAEINAANGWCILRMAGPRTLAVAKSLAAAGFEVWTPTMVKTARVPRRKVKVDSEVPIMPTFVFARAFHKVELLRIQAAPVSPHPPFSVFRYLGRIPTVADHDIASVRAAEERAARARRRAQRKVIPTGTHVRMIEGPCAGMAGIVEDGDGKFALVAFGGSFRMKIATFLLDDNAVEQKEPIKGRAAIAA